MTYKEFLKEKEKSSNSLPLHFAFSDSQLQKIKDKTGYKNEDLIFMGNGLFLHKNDVQLVTETVKGHSAKLKELLKDRDFFRSAMSYEMANHEYCITGELSDSLEALGINSNFITENNFTDIVEELHEEQMKNCF